MVDAVDIGVVYEKDAKSPVVFKQVLREKRKEHEDWLREQTLSNLRQTMMRAHVQEQVRKSTYESLGIDEDVQVEDQDHSQEG